MLREQPVDVKARLAAGEHVFVSMVVLHHPSVMEILRFTGFHIACIDGEHAPLDRQTLEHMVRAAECAGIWPIFRSTLATPEEILPFLDTGVKGIMVPHVNTAERARMVVDALRYAPLGTRGMTPGRANRYAMSGQTSADYVAQSNREMLAVIQVEEVEAVKNLNALLAVDGIDVYMIGPGDLAQSMGYPGQREHPEVLATIDNIIERVLAAGKVVGMSTGIEASRRLMARGVHYLLWGDGRMFFEAASGILKAVRDGATAR